MWLAVWSAIDRHGDHAAYVPKALEYQIPVYGNRNVVDKYPYVNLLTLNFRYSIGKFKVQCLEVPHNAPCYAYVIDCPSGERILFATDLNYFKYRVKGCDVIMMECNYSEDIIVDKMVEGKDIRSQSENHLELNDCMNALYNNVCEKTKLVLLLHLSDGLSNEMRFINRAKGVIRGLCVSKVLCATKGQTYEINESDF
ncbi:MAG: hypothetical protein KBT34_03025 [Prevotella sp.]|nr:hypothetical protein [Candidatus Prevotella equi]